MKRKKWYAVLLAILSAVVLCFAVGCGEKSREELCGEYAIRLIEDNGFYNPSSVRVLKAYYEDSEGNADIKLFACEAIVYCQIQAGTQSGGTQSCGMQSLSAVRETHNRCRVAKATLPETHLMSALSIRF